MVLAGQALTTNAAASGRLVLGIGLSHQIVIEGMWGYSFDKPARHMREYLSALMPLIRGEGISVEGQTLTARGQVTVPGSSPMPVVLAALAPRMLELAGSVADGTLTWCTGPATLESHVIPSINAAADKAGRDTPRVIAGLPVCVTDDKDAARERIAKALAIYPTLPSYKAMLDKEGVANPADIGLIGSRGRGARRHRATPKVGVTDFAASEMPAQRRRARAHPRRSGRRTHLALSLAGGPAAVDEEGLAGDVAAGVAREQQQRAVELVALAHAGHRGNAS